MDRTEIASHRGGAFLWPENSLLAFRKALTWPAEQIEFDVHASAEGEPVVIHDATLDRTTDGSGPVVAMPWGELQRLRVKGTGGECVPHLSEVAALIGPSAQRLRLEVKADPEKRPYPGLVARCGRLLDSLGLKPRTIMMSFERPSVAEAAALGGFEQIVWLVDGPALRAATPGDLVRECQGLGATEVGVHVKGATEALRDALRAQGLRLSVWGANHADTIHRALMLGVDVLATDDPPLAIELRRDAKPLR
ncbi:glycerophosphodiester phosphodiesterase [Sediminicoccus rosea]|jgi:glycerophosphoryl diester phosphodiesterase|uniref:Glycerophosphodiester phosphodiesterase family protein n=1 Tax=Sediminicoccus rosea TaxID=1225128 RepID=A0ABZ0PBF8_9PROT|nr:glycerophosphodiester phosphodiesterase family protein [Sediminicoccus rosea]WPB82970.1 glycerophosphodiester phosphodiesterase family protein [Sediminicoccus rosea]